MTKHDKILTGCLATVAGSLILVGVASGTVIRHVVQVAVAVIALTLIIQRLKWAAYAGAAVFSFWLLIMSLIWLYLFGLSTFASGTYSAVERSLTAIIGLACLLGLMVVVHARPRVAPLQAFSAVAIFAALQVAVMWLSFQPAFSHD